MARSGSFGDVNGIFGGTGRGRHGALLRGAFHGRHGEPVRFVAGRAVRRDVARPALSAMAPGDEVDVRKWPVPARLAFMVLGSLILWLGIAMLIGLLR